MKWILTKHAKKRMLERNIKLEEIQEVIEVPDYTVKKNSIIEAHRKIGNKSLKVVYAKEDNFINVITVIER